jgi:hypothetical protein
LNNESASLSGSSARVRLPCGAAARRSRLDRGCAGQGRCVAAVHCTRRRGNAHRTEKRKVLYLWHPWAGCTVQIYEVIDKMTGTMARCSHDDSRADRLLELPLWMFDQSACAPMRVATHPHVDIAALRALRALLNATAIGDVEVRRTPSNAPVWGAAKASRNQNRGEAHATTTAESTRPPKRNASVQSIHHGEQQHDTGAGMADAAKANAPSAEGSDDTSHLRSRRQRLSSSTEKGRS